jgi:hypothetical protein
MSPADRAALQAALRLADRIRAEDEAVARGAAPADPFIHPDDVKPAKDLTRTIGQMLVSAGPQGVTSGQLRLVCARYGARLHDLRRSGWNIRTMRAGPMRYTYVLKPLPE